MNRLWLIDDNSRNQRVVYGMSAIDDGAYDDILEHIERLNDSSDFSFLTVAELVMIHDSHEDCIEGRFIENSHLARERIEQYLVDSDIRFVRFSDGHNTIGEFDSAGNIVSLKKSDFYGRLGYFLEHYRETGEIELKVLAYGRHFCKFVVERDVKRLSMKLSMLTDDTALTPGAVVPEYDSETNYLKNIIDAAQPAIGMDYEDVIDFIEDTEISVREFKRRINNILTSVSKYGQNTYTWE